MYKKQEYRNIGILEHRSTGTLRNTLEHPGMPRNTKFDGVVLFSITKELRARYKVYVYEIELEFRIVGFCGGRKTGEPGEKQTTNSTTFT